MGILRFFIYGNILVSISVGMLTLGVGSFYAYENSYLHALCATCATLFIYNLQRLLRFDDVMKQSSVRHSWLVKHKRLIIFLSLIGGVGALVTYLVLGITNDIFIVGSLTLVGILYAYRGVKQSALRDLPFIKIYLIAIVWTGVSVLWPAYRQPHYDYSIIPVFVSVFLYVLASTIPFDIRDLIYDSHHQRTLPQLLGEKGGKALGVCLLVISAAVLLFSFPSFLQSPFFYLAYFGMMFLLILTTKKKREMFFSGLIDGWIILLGMMFWSTVF